MHRPAGRHPGRPRRAGHPGAGAAGELRLRGRQLSPSRWQRIARLQAGEDYARTYAKRFRSLAARGQDVHGEAAFVTGLLDPPGWVLDAGCGTGRITVRLAELGYDVVGVDVDEPMLAVARAEAPDLDWRLGDLATLDLGRRFDVVLLAGNIVPLLEPGTLCDVAASLARHVVPDGQVVCGFGLDADHLPGDCPVTPLTDFLAAMTAARLEEAERLSGWAGEPWDAGSGYVVTVHRLVDG